MTQRKKCKFFHMIDDWLEPRYYKVKLYKMKQELESFVGLLVKAKNNKIVAQLESLVAKHEATITRLKRCMRWIVLLVCWVSLVCHEVIYVMTSLLILLYDGCKNSNLDACLLRLMYNSNQYACMSFVRLW